MGKQKVRPRLANSLQSWKVKDLVLIIVKSNRAAGRLKERGAALKHQYFLIMQITNQNLCVEFRSKCMRAMLPYIRKTRK